MRLVFAGTPEVALPSLERLASEHDIVAVLTRPDAAKGRSGRLQPSPVGAWAEAHGVVALKPTSTRDPELAAQLAELAPEACPVVAYGGLLTRELLQIPTYGWINLHFSLLPRWRGAAPVQRAIMAGDAVTGATTFGIVRALDAGPVYRTLERPLDGTETAGALLAELAGSGAGLLAETIASVATVEPTPQSEAGLTVAPKLTVPEAHVDWGRPAVEIGRQIRGCSPEPMAWTMLGDERVKLADARPAASAELAPGELLPGKRTLLVGTGDGDLELVRVQPPGKREMPGADWGRGLRPPLRFTSGTP